MGAALLEQAILVPSNARWTSLTMGAGEGILGWGSWVGQNNLTRNRPTDWTSGSSYFTRFR